jgi:cathepsin L
MRVLAVILTVFVGAISTASLTSDDAHVRYPELTSFEKTWALFKATHDKQYESPEIESYRKLIFAENLKRIENHNYLYERGLASFSMGINQFSDMEVDEFSRMMNGFKNPNVGEKKVKGSAYLPLNDLPELPKWVDWTKKGYVTEVKDQKQCGSCWAFSATGSLEGQTFHKTGKLVSLSEQNLVDCSREEGNEGCGGGYMDYAFQYIQDNDGIDTEMSYPYVGKDGKCHYNAATKGATDMGFVDIATGNETMLKEVVATIGPVSVAIDAGHMSFMQYSGGVYDEPKCSSENLDHGVLVVGYGTDNGQDFWLVKNSWGEKWGTMGYLKMSRNKNNQCGIATMASYPLV